MRILKVKIVIMILLVNYPLLHYPSGWCLSRNLSLVNYYITTVLLSSIDKSEYFSVKSNSELAPQNPDVIFVSSVDEALDKVNGNGKFAWSHALPLGTGYGFGMTFLLPYLIQIPQLQ